jgi:hypothetical protein
LLMGQFVVLLTAKNSTIGPYVLGGVISGDGAGHISGGTFDEQDGSGNGTAGAHPTSGVYTIGSDGRGQIHLQFSPGLLPLFGNGTINLSVVFINPQHALLTEIDGFGTGTGTLDLQSLSSWTRLNGVYSLKLSGFDTGRANANYFLGSAVTIPSATSYSYITDQSDAGVITSVAFNTVPHDFLNGAAPDALTGELTVGQVDLGLPAPLNLDLWVIDATHLVVTDWRDPAFVGGYITFQPSTPSVSGTYAFTEAGATTAAQPLVAGGIFTCGSSGILDVVPLTGAGTLLTNQVISAVCAAPTNGRALITISGATTAGISKFAAYPTSDQGLYLLELDGGASGPSGAGVALQQASGIPNLTGKYASDFLATTSAGAENFAGQIISDGVSALSGTADVNSFTATPPAGSPSSGVSLTGSFAAPANGRFALVLTFTPATGQPTPQVPTIQPACYIVDANTCLLLGLDATAPGTGILLLQHTGL